VNSAGSAASSFVGHKWLLGPEGLALFYTTPEARDRLGLKQFGWHMVEHAGDFDRKDWKAAESARRFECGSQNTTGIHALNASLSLFLEAGMENIEKEVLNRTEYLFKKIEAAPELELITSAEKGRYAGIVTLRHKRTDNEVLYKYLTLNNVVCSLRGGAVRLSPHFYTPFDHLDTVMDMIKRFEL
jgi:selenocysteine lyase/cysteine desulfurase